MSRTSGEDLAMFFFALLLFPTFFHDFFLCLQFLTLSVSLAAIVYSVCPEKTATVYSW